MNNTTRSVIAVCGALGANAQTRRPHRSPGKTFGQLPGTLDAKQMFSLGKCTKRVSSRRTSSPMVPWDRSTSSAAFTLGSRRTFALPLPLVELLPCAFLCELFGVVCCVAPAVAECGECALDEEEAAALLCHARYVRPVTCQLANTPETSSSNGFIPPVEAAVPSALKGSWFLNSLCGLRVCWEEARAHLARGTSNVALRVGRRSPHVTTSHAQHGSKANSHTIDGKSWKGVTQAQMTAFRYSCPSFCYLLLLFLFLFFLLISVLCGCLLADDHRTITKNIPHVTRPGMVEQ